MSRHRNPRARIPELGELWNPEGDEDDERSPAQVLADEALEDDMRTERMIDARYDR